MKSIDHLISEHDNILVLTQIMESACVKIILWDSINTNDWQNMVSFGRIYADKLHHQKEENILFAEMVTTLGDIAKKLIQNGMLVEHDLGRLYLKQLEEAIVALRTDSSDALAKIKVIGNAVAYRDLLRRHIDKENDVVFNYGKNNMSEDSILKVEKLSMQAESNPDTIALEKAQLKNLALLQEKYL